MRRHNKKNTEMRTLIVAAKVISTTFRPVYYPLLCCAVLFVFTPLSRLPWMYKFVELAIIAMFTIVLPSTLTFVYHQIRRLDHWQKGQRLNLIVPYMLHLACYMAYIHFMYGASVPYPILGVIIVSLCIQIACTLINLMWKVSVHAAGAGAIVGGLAAYGLLFRFNPLPWMIIAILICGLLGTARMILRQHTLSQILIGTLIGILCGFFGILRGDIFF